MTSASQPRGRRRGRRSDHPAEAAPWPDPDRWTTQDRWAQYERFDAYARSPLTIEAPGEEPRHFPPDLRPYLSHGEGHKRLMHLRCGVPKCGALVGAVYCVSARHRGSPFTWAEMKRADERHAYQVFKMILDDVSAPLRVESECPVHGLVAAPVAEVLDRLPAAAVRLAEKGKSAVFVLLRDAS